MKDETSRWLLYAKENLDSAILLISPPVETGGE